MKAVKYLSILLYLSIFAISFFIISCSESEDPEPGGGNNDPCDNGPEVSVDIELHTYVGQESGVAKVSLSGGNGEVELTIDGEPLEGNTLEGLGSGQYTIIAVDDSLCTSSVAFNIEEYPEVSFANDVFPIIQTNCRVSGCHGDQAGIPSWANYSVIKSEAERIRFRVTGKSMPPATSGMALTDEEILIIQNWVDVGAPNN